MSITLNYCYRIYPDASQEQTFLEWLEISRSTYNYALREIKDWVNSRKCSWDFCSLEKEYIIPVDAPFPGYYKQQNALPKAKKEYPRLSAVPSQVLQTTIRRLHDGWDFFFKRGYGFPRFKKYGQFQSLLFPQVKVDCLTGWQITLPKIGSISINLHRRNECGYQTHRDHASAEVIRVRGLEQLVARDSGESKQPDAVGLPGIGESQSRSEAKPFVRKGGRRTRNASS